MKPECRELRWCRHHPSLAKLRCEVFIREQQVPLADEWDGLDPSAWHFGVFIDNQLVGCARVVRDTWQQREALHLGRVAVAKQCRNRRLGTALIDYILRWAEPSLPLFLYAQINAIEFYQQFGFSVCSEVFMDAGIPHQAMLYQYR
ncbi:GNAT family N-acetyltransferase [Gilvimarinus sp. DA14]|uniref:GNAT family N-acetyltransferase n=1 Tax=Gilvimarinus sp. DA14 TaxID=2956798 RepID=UPI0020B7B40C|nr:GNAT family N-acetyltransferase [Gilvimarinus sp. DA14]UTF60310.1 GNAT family N-acetyltransferase [Gilvimarinus sp. DA14]